MSTQQVSRRYARALYDLIVEGVSLQSGLQKLAAACSVDGVSAILAAPTIKPERKVALLEKVIADEPKELHRLVQLLAQRNKLVLLPEIARLVEDMVRASRDEVTAEVTVASETSPEVERKIAEALARSVGKKVSLRTRRNPEILGGLIVRIGDRLIDYSLRTRLEAMRQAIAGQK
ncbi:MAG: ATP synthase F1 subunit delta [Zetaproteobacteria bacterium]|nr:MAG: ATP synthase F1 subunit delta [Zetaproteobacteria bacterium]